MDTGHRMFDSMRVFITKNSPLFHRNSIVRAAIAHLLHASSATLSMRARSSSTGEGFSSTSVAMRSEQSRSLRRDGVVLFAVAGKSGNSMWRWVAEIFFHSRDCLTAERRRRSRRRLTGILYGG